MSAMRLYIILVCLLLFVSGKEEKQYQSDVHDLMSSLGLTGHNSSENLMFTPPTLSVDIVSLLRWAVETQIQQNKNNGRARCEQNLLLNNRTAEYVYPKSFMNLVPFNGKNYFFSKNQKFTWAESLAFCRSFGMDLVSVETKEENAFIVQELDTLGLTDKYVWISANKIGRSSFVWINGEQLIYENWAAGNPASPATENCAFYSGKKWHDIPCNNNPQHTWDNYFICEDRQ